MPLILLKPQTKRNVCYTAWKVNFQFFTAEILWNFTACSLLPSHEEKHLGVQETAVTLLIGARGAT